MNKSIIFLFLLITVLISSCGYDVTEPVEGGSIFDNVPDLVTPEFCHYACPKACEENGKIDETGNWDWIRLSTIEEGRCRCRCPPIGSEVLFRLPGVPREETLEEKCKKSYDNCKEIFELKYEQSLSIIKMEKFGDMSEAKEFYNTWKHVGAQDDDELTGSSLTRTAGARFPVVLFVVKSKGPKGSFTGVSVCESSGDFTERSKREMCR